MTSLPAFDDDPLAQSVIDARETLAIEAKALRTLADSLDDSFDGVVSLIERISGRVIVTGVGKSGHIGHKIAATLASTGTPASFVHAAEASHGDLGMIGRNDAVMALSKSGSVAELAAIISYAKRYTIPLIGMTADAASRLGRHADHLLLLPPMEEACPLGLAPTTSTTAMLALSDALAVALLKRRGFTTEDFKVFHPGGTLGNRLTKVSEIMHQGNAIPLVSDWTKMSDVVVEMTSKSFGCAGVTEASGKLIGIVTDGDLRRHMATDLLDKPVADVMTSNPRIIGADALAVAALAKMNGESEGDRPVTSLFVVDSNHHAIGILHLHDCLRASVA